MEELIDLEDLKPRFTLGDNLVLLSYKDTSNCVQVDFSDFTISEVQHIEKFLKFNPFQVVSEIKDYSYQDRINKEFQSQQILKLLKDMTKSINIVEVEEKINKEDHKKWL